nr:hypothetical protein [Mycolicibacterium hippocampi]
MGSDDGLLTPMEGTDSDDLRNADGDEVVDPPEGWSGVDGFGMSSDEQAEGESLDDRLAQEEADVLDDAVEGVDQKSSSADVAPGAPGKSSGQIDGAPEDGGPLFRVVR